MESETTSEPTEVSALTDPSVLRGVIKVGRAGECLVIWEECPVWLLVLRPLEWKIIWVDEWPDDKFHVSKLVLGRMKKRVPGLTTALSVVFASGPE